MRHGFRYEANYGFVPGTRAPDGDELDAYFLGTTVPLERAQGEVIAIVHRTDEDDDKLVVVASGTTMSDDGPSRRARRADQRGKDPGTGR